MRGLEWIVGLIWIATGAALSTRTHFVFNYAAYANLPPTFEVIAVSLWVLSVLAFTLAGLFVTARFGDGFAISSDDSEVMTLRKTRPSLWGYRSSVCLLVASLPLGLSLSRAFAPTVQNKPVSVGWWEPIVFAMLTGLAFYLVKRPERNRGDVEPRDVSESRISFLVVGVAASFCACWWFWQTNSLFDNFQLGFNDFGHFLLRVIRTSRGEGFLMETPVLPTYWDHFNPGLALLVPVWLAFPSVKLVFALQAISLAGSSVLVYGIAVRHGLSRSNAALWGLAWLVYPSVGQMNLAYTYGWHPITFAIPALLAAYWMLQRGWLLGAMALAVLASSFEEGAIAAVGCFAAMQGLRSLLDSTNGSVGEADNMPLRIPAQAWWIVWLIATFGFLAVYRWSGMAAFQTGRFAKLGGSGLEILFSPILKPTVFIELLFRERNGAFLAFLFAPFCVCMSRKAFAWTLLAVAPLFLVLLLWEHMPAQSLAFQYTSVILPTLFIGGIESSCPKSSARISTCVFCTGWILSIFVGQLPWSGDSLVDVKLRSYGPQTQWTRSAGTEDHRVFHEQIRNIRENGIFESRAFSECRILATGRLASHLLGAKDLETVGQFWQRFEDYRKLEPDLESPLLRYDLIVLDPIEEFQQTLEETQSVRDQALALGFKFVPTAYGFNVLTRR
jgi:uncharacterized membrane protein